MADAECRATMDVLTAVMPAALFTAENLLSLVICRMANLSLEHGNSDGSCFAYVWLGMLLGIRFGNYRAGFSFGKLGLDLVEQRGLRRFEARVYLLFGIDSPWTQPVRSGLSLVRRALDLISAHLRLIQTLRGLTPEFGSFDDTEFDEGRFEQQLAEDPRHSVVAFLYW